MSLLKHLSPRQKHWLRRILWPLMRGWPDEGRRIVQGPVLRALLDQAVALRPRRVFNAGAGEGGYSGMLLALPTVEALIESDLSTNIQPAADPRRLYFSASLTDLPLPDGCVDLVVCTEVLEHIPDDRKALHELVRILDPNGCLVISVPTPPAVYDRNHVREGYRRAELASMLSEVGFEIVDTRYCMYWGFRWVLAHWPDLRYCPKLLIWTLSYLDRVLPVGPPMDIAVLARAGRIRTPQQSAPETNACLTR